MTKTATMACETAVVNTATHVPSLGQRHGTAHDAVDMTRQRTALVAPTWRINVSRASIAGGTFPDGAFTLAAPDGTPTAPTAPIPPTPPILLIPCYHRALFSVPGTAYS
eukprot:1721137-Rhodomonas_salina.1